MQSLTYNFRDHEKGDTLNEVEFQLIINTIPVNITGVVIKSVFSIGNQSNVMSIGSGMAFTDPVLGKFKINRQIINWERGSWIFEISFTFLDGTVKTYLKGQINII